MQRRDFIALLSGARVGLLGAGLIRSFTFEYELAIFRYRPVPLC
jgi:hypothetical protein